MWYRDVSNKNAVIKAIEEFRTPGRDKFLEKYRFASARLYFVLYNGEYYDQFGRPPISHASSGTNRTVRPKLESMDFRVERKGGAA